MDRRKFIGGTIAVGAAALGNSPEILSAVGLACTLGPVRGKELMVNVTSKVYQGLSAEEVLDLFNYDLCAAYAASDGFPSVVDLGFLRDDAIEWRKIAVEGRRLRYV